VVARHTAAEHVVAFLGFLPGFAYLVGGDELLHVPRLDEPRTQVPAGSVAIAGPYSGVYPRASPGGWRLLGSTSTPMFDATRESPALLAPGDRVRFIAT
jgi:KipI family sensor histidine kinase inhibitor